MGRKEQEELAKGQALMASLVGRTITAARWWDENPAQSWTHHETGMLWLDDGRVIEFSSYGYDADGATVREVTDGS